MGTTRTSTHFRAAVLVAVILLFVIAHATGLFDVFRDGARVRSMLIDWGVWGHVFYLLTFIVLEPFGVPAIFFIIPAGLVWAKPVAAALSFLAGIGASLLGFSFARYLARDWVAEHLPLRFRHYDAELGRRALKTVLFLRLAFFLAPPSHWVLGLSRVGFLPFLLGTALGIIPGVLLITYVGSSLVEWLAAQLPTAWLLALALLGAWLLLRWRRRNEARTEP